MRVLYLTQWFEPEPAFKGAAFARALSVLECEVQVATGFPNYPGGKLYPGYRIRPFARETIDGVSVHRLPLWPSHDRSMLGRMANYLSFFLSTLAYCLLAVRRYDIVYVYHPPVTPALAAALAGLLHRTPFIVEIQDLWPDSVAVSGMAKPRLVGFIDRLCRFVYRRAAHIVCQSDGMVKRLTERGVPREKLTRIYNWSNYLPAGSDAPDIPEPLARSFAGRINVVYGGNIGQAQALEQLLEAAILAQQEIPALRLHIVGNGIERDRIAALASRTPDAVALHPPVSRQVMDRIFERADILALHLKDGALFDITIPSKLQHYLSMGKPVVAGIGGEAASLLKRSGAALVSAPGDVDSMSQNIVELALLEPVVRAGMGAAGRTFYLRNLSFSAALQSTAALLRAHCKGARVASDRTETP